MLHSCSNRVTHIHIEPACNHALQLLGIEATNTAIQQMIVDAGANESGEVGYNDFVAMMAPILSCKVAEPSSRGKAAQTVVKSGSAVSFDTSINEYRRCLCVFDSVAVYLKQQRPML